MAQGLGKGHWHTRGFQHDVRAHPFSEGADVLQTVGFGHVSSTTGIRDNPTQMQISVPIQRGNSGGPVVNDKGEREVLDDAGRAQETQRAREVIASDCR